MNLRKEISFTLFGWTLGAGLSLGWLLFEVAWETSPPSFTVIVPLLCFWIERAETDYRKEPCRGDGACCD
jgi:hypothetical protein